MANVLTGVSERQKASCNDYSLKSWRDYRNKFNHWQALGKTSATLQDAAGFDIAAQLAKPLGLPSAQCQHHRHAPLLALRNG